LRDRGLDVTRPVLVVIDGTRALRAASDATITAVTPRKEDAA
jgi:hypothetical protein